MIAIGAACVGTSENRHSEKRRKMCDRNALSFSTL